jgi:hypothetical protein
MELNQPNSVKQKMRRRQLRSGVNRQGALKGPYNKTLMQMQIKQTKGRKKKRQRKLRSGVN